jgi:hypothetical protein
LTSIASRQTLASPVLVAVRGLAADSPNFTSSESRSKETTADGTGSGEDGGVEGDGEADAEGLGSAWAGDMTATRLEPTKTAPRAMAVRRRPGVSGGLAAFVGIGAFSSSRMARQGSFCAPARGEFRRA